MKNVLFHLALFLIAASTAYNASAQSAPESDEAIYVCAPDLKPSAELVARANAEATRVMALDSKRLVAPEVGMAARMANVKRAKNIKTKHCDSANK
jgi:hypothetical protein